LVSFSLTLIQTIAKADSLMQARSYLNAEISYERALFFADSSIVLVVINKIALCKEVINNYSEAADLFNMANNYEIIDSLYFLNLLKQAVCLVLDNQLIEVNRKLKEFKYSAAPSYYCKKAFLLLSIVESQYLNFELASQYFDSTYNLLNGNNKMCFQKLLLNNKIIGKINPKMAAFYSALIPGLGQTISGDFKSGVIFFIKWGIYNCLYCLRNKL